MALVSPQVYRTTAQHQLRIASHNCRRLRLNPAAKLFPRSPQQWVGVSAMRDILGQTARSFGVPATATATGCASMARARVTRATAAATAHVQNAPPLASTVASAPVVASADVQSASTALTVGLPSAARHRHRRRRRRRHPERRHYYASRQQCRTALRARAAATARVTATAHSAYVGAPPDGQGQDAGRPPARQPVASRGVGVVSRAVSAAAGVRGSLRAASTARAQMTARDTATAMLAKPRARVSPASPEPIVALRGAHGSAVVGASARAAARVCAGRPTRVPRATSSR
jgi:hypothetical protein